MYSTVPRHMPSNGEPHAYAQKWVTRNSRRDNPSEDSQGGESFLEHVVSEVAIPTSVVDRNDTIIGRPLNEIERRDDALRIVTLI